jgi:hypothetical protein
MTLDMVAAGDRRALKTACSWAADWNGLSSGPPSMTQALLPAAGWGKGPQRCACVGLFAAPAVLVLCLPYD